MENGKSLKSTSENRRRTNAYLSILGEHQVQYHIYGIREVNCERTVYSFLFPNDTRHTFNSIQHCNGEQEQWRHLSVHWQLSKYKKGKLSSKSVSSNVWHCLTIYIDVTAVSISFRTLIALPLQWDITMRKVSFVAILLISTDIGYHHHESWPLF